MAASWTAEQVLALAPDPASARSGRELAAIRHWVSAGSSASAIWGECQGSGKQPYQTRIDLGGPAFGCSCPSRKFPCKHALGLLLLFVESPAAVPAATPPTWVETWLATRAQKTEQKSRAPAAEADPRTAERRRAERERRIVAGLDECQLWLTDLIRQGLAALPQYPASRFEQAAARLVDAQAPGLARLVRQIAPIAASGEGWQERLLAKLSRLHLLIEGYRRQAALPAALCEEVRQLVGWTVSQEALLAQPGLCDLWTVLGQRSEEEDRLRVQRTWLLGCRSSRPALLLQFTPPGAPPAEITFLPGSAFEAELVFFPAASPLRALIKQRQPETAQMPPGGHALITDALAAWGSVLAVSPWLELWPLVLSAATPVYRQERWWVQDSEGAILPLAVSTALGWQILATSGGRPIGLCGEWDGERLRPLSLWDEGKCLPLGGAS